jgi:hypothetical protein
MAAYTSESFQALINQTVKNIKDLSTLKGGEYSGDNDRLANFRRNADALGLNMETVWSVYAAKHWDAIIQEIKDKNTGLTRSRLETIDGRIDDLILYLLLYKAIREDVAATEQAIADKVNQKLRTNPAAFLNSTALTQTQSPAPAPTQADPAPDAPASADPANASTVVMGRPAPAAATSPGDAPTYDQLLAMGNVASQK